jgi:uncharacterized repeat protein (TIGR01451 family)
VTNSAQTARTQDSTIRIIFILICPVLLFAIFVSSIMPATAQTGTLYYVDADAAGPTHDGLSWTTAYTNVQDALSAAVAGDEIWMAEGVYYPDVGSGRTDGDRASTFQLASGVALYGGFVGNETNRDQRDWTTYVTILSGDLDQDDTNTDGNSIAETYTDIVGSNARNVVVGSGADDTTVLDGFTITAGNADGSGCPGSPAACGGGMIITGSGSDPVVRNVIFSGNQAAWAGGGGMMLMNNSNPSLMQVTFTGNGTSGGGNGGGMRTWNALGVLTDVTFYNNSATYGGGMGIERANPHLTDVVFSENTATSHGGGLFTFSDEVGNTSPDLARVTFSQNSAEGNGGGMYNYKTTPQLVNTAFLSNTAHYGGGMFNDTNSNPQLTNAIFSGNSVEYAGGGMQNSHSSPQLTNVTVSGNMANQYGGGIGGLYSNLNLTNCIVWGNGASGFDPQIGNLYGTSVISASLVQGSGGSGAGWDTSLGTDGGGNIDADPHFVSPISPADAPTTAGDLRLSGVSPAIDAGNTSAVSVATDLDGNPRIAGNVVDMGAYEFSSVNIRKSVTPTSVSRYGTVTYTVTLFNYQTVDETNAVFTDSLPDEVDFVNWVEQPAGASQSNDEINWTGTLTANTPLTFTFSAAHTGNYGDVVTNTAEYSGSLMLNDSASFEVGAVDLEIAKTVEPAGARPGQPVTYTLAFSNTGLASADAVVIADSVPLSVTSTGVTSTTDVPLVLRGGTRYIWDASSLAPNQGGTITITGILAQSLPRGEFTNTATISSTTQDGNNADNVAHAELHIGGLLYVHAGAAGAGTGFSWTDAFTEVQSALAIAGPGDEIWVAEGVYTPDYDPASGAYTGNRMATFQWESGIALYGGFAGNEASRYQRDWSAHVATLSGDIGTIGDHSDNAYHVITSNALDDTCKLDGFVVSGGFANGSNPYDRGGGMYNDGGNPVLRNVIFTANAATSHGGGIFNRGSSTLIDVSFFNNSSDARGGGIYNVGDNSPQLINVTFYGNTANEGGGVYNRNSAAHIINATFSGNSAVNGGGLYNYNYLYGTPTLIQATFSNNVASGPGGGIYNLFGDSIIHNSVVWGNTPDQIYDDSSTPSVTYSLVQGASIYPGTGNINSDPLFVDADGPDDTAGTTDDDVRLQGASPAIDAGDNSVLPADSLDLDSDGDTTEKIPIDLEGKARLVDDPAVTDTGNGTAPVVDMGAYEEQPGAIYLPLVLK